MKEGIHPDYHDIKVVCACGNSFNTRSTKKGDLMKIEICNMCHPFYTGKQTHIETGGRIDRFKIRQSKTKKTDTTKKKVTAKK